MGSGGCGGHGGRAVLGDWYRPLEVPGLRGLRGAPSGAGLMFAGSRSADLVQLGAADLFLVHSLAMPGSARFTVQSLGACCRYRLRFVTAAGKQGEVG